MKTWITSDIIRCEEILETKNEKVALNYHTAMVYYKEGKHYWDYNAVKKAF